MSWKSGGLNLVISIYWQKSLVEQLSTELTVTLWLSIRFWIKEISPTDKWKVITIYHIDLKRTLCAILPQWIIVKCWRHHPLYRQMLKPSPKVCSCITISAINTQENVWSCQRVFQGNTSKQGFNNNPTTLTEALQRWSKTIPSSRGN